MNEKDMHRVVDRHFCEIFEEVVQEHPLPYDTTVDFYIPSVPMLVECKLKCSPYYVGTALGQVVMYRELLKEIRVEGPIKLGLCFCNLPNAPEKWLEWGDLQANLLKDITDKLGEEVRVFLVRERDGIMYVDEEEMRE